jgi:serine/threonine protein kinase
MRLLREGEVIRGTYEVERFLGEGAFAEVYRVKHRFLGRQAMKVFKTAGMSVQETEEMLLEALMLSRISHPNIIRVFEPNTIDTSKGICGFFTMEYVAGGSLEQFWKSYGADLVPVDTAVEILRQACRGLAVAHDARPPIVHRDIKPPNLLVGYDAGGLRVRVSDFGLAKHVNELTMLATTLGTTAFKAPEALLDYHSDSCAGDVWALGCTLYLLLTDRLPFTGVTTFGHPNIAAFDRPIILPSRLNINVDPLLDHIIDRALAIDRTQRYQNAGEMLADLDAWCSRPEGKAAAAKPMMRSSDIAKSALGRQAPLSEAGARSKIRQAMQLARQSAKLVEAADLLEEALNEWPDLRAEFEYQLKLWRRGIMM